MRSTIAYFVLLTSFSIANGIALLNSYFPQRLKKRSNCIVVTGTFHNPNWFISHLLPLTKSGIREVIVVADEPHSKIDHLTYYCPPAWARKLFGRALAKFIWLMLAGIRYQPDLYMGYHIFPNGINALIASRFFGRPACYQMCGGPVEVLGGGINCENRLMRWLGQPSQQIERLALATLRKFECIVVRGMSAKKFLIENGFQKHVAIIPGSIQPPVMQVLEERIYDLIFVGRLEEIKQPHQVIKTIAIVAQSHPQLRAVFLGDGPLIVEMKALAATLNITENIQFMGKRKDVEAFLRKAKMFILTSRSEGLSIAMAEAMAAGAVPLVANVGDLGDLVQDGKNGYLIEPNEITQYAKQIIYLLANKRQLLRLSQSAMQAARDYNAVDVVAQRWQKCFEEIYNSHTLSARESEREGQ